MHCIFEFDNFRFDPAVPSLTCGSDLVDLTPKALDVLSVLVTNAGQVVRKDDLLGLVWPHTVVEEGNLAVHVSFLRQVLAKHGNGGCQIQTVPKLGYRLAALVRTVRQIGAVPTNDLSTLFRVAEHYLYQNSVSGCRKATEIFQKCIHDNPTNVEARAGLADSLLMGFICGDVGRDGVGAALELLAEAKQIEPDCPRVHLSLSRLHCVWDFQWQRATDELQHGLELATDLTTKLAARALQGVYLARWGDLDQGLRQLREASLSFPLSPYVWYFLAEAHLLARDFSGAAAVTTEALQLHPNCWYLQGTAAKAFTMLGEYAEALRHVRLAKLLCPEPDFELVAAFAYVHAMAGRRDPAVRLLTRVMERPAGRHVSFTSVAVVQAALGDKERALDSVEAACGAHEWYIPALKRDFRVDTLRTAPRFRKVLSRIGM